MNTSTATAPTALRRFTAAVIGTGAIAVGLMAMTPAVAVASPKSDCGLYDSRDVYTTSTDAQGNVTEKCCYYSGLIVELWTCRTWVNGAEISHEDPPAPPVKPGAAPPAQAPNNGVLHPGPKPTPRPTPAPLASNGGVK